MIRALALGSWSILLATGAQPLAREPSPSFADEVVALLSVPRVVGREGPAADLVVQRLADPRVERDRLGSVVLVVGTGAPRRLFAAPLDEPGFAVSRIQEDGYLRLVPLGDGRRGGLWDQFHFGQEVTIATARGEVAGAIATPSTHLGRLRRDTAEPLTFHDAFVDVGAESAAEVAALGIELMDPVTLVERPTRLADGTIAAPSSALGASAIALVESARRAARHGVGGTAVFAWTVLDSLNLKGLEAVLHRFGPFDHAVLLTDRFARERGGRPADAEARPPGSGPLAAGRPPLAGWARDVTPIDERRPSPGTGGPRWGPTPITWLGLPSRFAATPVETVSLADARELADLLAAIAGAGDGERIEAPDLPEQSTSARAPLPRESAEALTALVARAGVSGAEGPVRDEIRSRLPAWAEPRVDDAGNLTVRFGPEATAADVRAAHRVFVAHMDEVGFGVERIRDDGLLEVVRRGGFYSWLWEAQAAVVRTASGDLPAIFRPRPGYLEAEERAPRDPLLVDMGARSRERALELGVIEADSTVTMPKRLERIGRHRALARGLDDRAGSTALLLALARIDRMKVTRPVTFAWSVEEEVGLNGAAALAARLGEVATVFPVDTHVSSDSPLESDAHAWSRLGGGAVLRALESIHFVHRDDLEHLRALARARGIPLQVAMTHGGTDGQPFLAYGGRSVPISWPGRYSHSPVEVMDLRDLDALVDLIVALVEEQVGEQPQEAVGRPW